MTSSWFALETELRFCNSKAWLEVEVDVDGSMGVLKLYSRLHLSQIFHNTIIHRLCVLYQQQRQQVRMPSQSCGPKSLSSFLLFYICFVFSNAMIHLYAYWTKSLHVVHDTIQY